jgi:hypothetical protein
LLSDDPDASFVDVFGRQLLAIELPMRPSATICALMPDMFPPALASHHQYRAAGHGRIRIITYRGSYVFQAD